MELVGQSKPERVLIEGSLLEADPDIVSGYAHVDLRDHNLAAPLLQIFSVHIHTMFDDGKPCEIYGSIQATEGQGTNFELYGRGVSEAETLWKHGSLTLIDLKEHAMLGVTRVALDLDLKDRIRDIQLIKKRCYLESATEGIEDSNEKLKIGVIQGEHSVAYLYYIAFRFAIFATVEIEIVEKGDESGRFVDVYGSLVASYSNSRQYCNNDDELEYLETVLFDKPSKQPVRIVSGTSVKLKSRMVVPAYSSVVINADLFESQGQFVSGRKVFPAVAGFGATDSIQSKNGFLHVTVTFSHPYPWIYEYELRKGNNSRVHGFPKTYYSSSSNLKGGVPQPISAIGPEIRQSSLLELFSVYVGGIDHAVHALCGTVKVYESIKPTCIYDKDMDDLEMLSEDKIVPIKIDFALEHEELVMAVDLKDPTQNLEVSKGHLSWWGEGLNMSCGISWYGKRICSVIRGSSGYSAIHYMMIRSGVIATVEVVFYPENSGACIIPSIHGTLIAYYGDHEYYTDYDKKFYRSILFQRSQSKLVILGAGSSSRVPLSKSVVAVPVNTSLVIEADLKIIYGDDSHEEVVCDKKEFVIGMSSMICKEIRGSGCRFEMSVKLTKGMI